MTEPADKLAPAEPRGLADAIAFALRFEGRKRVLERAGFVVMKKPPQFVGGAALGRGFEG